MLRMQRALSLIYPDQCLLCPELVEINGGLCGSCWRDMPFLRGLVCHACGSALQGSGDGAHEYCDDCLVMPRPWISGRAALSYRDAARRLVLTLKHGDRPELAKQVAGWMKAAGQPLLTPSTVVVPVPIHWSRLLRRKYNQSAELARALARSADLEFEPQALLRTRRTPVQDGLGVASRFDNIEGAISDHPKYGQALKDRHVCLVDDVMTSGATLSFSTEACLQAGAASVSVLVLARVEKAT